MQSTPADRLRQEGNPMNYVMLSPHFPVNYKHFAMRLKARGINVLGIASEPYESLDPDLRESLTEYYRVEEMEDYKDMFRACAFLSFRHGKLDRIESHNEYWLETDAALRTDFNVPGDKTGDVWRVRHKSAMKEIFRSAGVSVIRGAVLRTREEILALAGEVGFPLCAKPDDGVGACGTFKIHDLAELDRFLQQKPPIDYMVEEYIEGRIETFDGLADRDGLKRKYSHADIMGKYGHLIMEHFPLPEAFARVMGQYAYIFRTPERSEMEDVIRYMGSME